MRVLLAWGRRKSRDVLNLFRSLFPKTYFSFTVAAPHFWVRYEGLEIGRGTLEIVMELNMYQP